MMNIYATGLTTAFLSIAFLMATLGACKSAKINKNSVKEYGDSDGTSKAKEEANGQQGRYKCIENGTSWSKKNLHVALNGENSSVKAKITFVNKDPITLIASQIKKDCRDVKSYTSIDPKWCVRLNLENTDNKGEVILLMAVINETEAYHFAPKNLSRIPTSTSQLPVNKNNFDGPIKYNCKLQADDGED
jgi:hypothetical protein